MSSVLIENVRLPGDGASFHSVLIEGGRIEDIAHAGRSIKAHRTIDANGDMIFPGFIDIHIHGAVGVDVNEADAEGLLKIAFFLAANGVTSWVPTLVPDADNNYRRVISEIESLMRLQAGVPVAQAVGVHYEGVFANEKMCGALRPEFFKSGSQWSVDGGRLPKLKSGVHITTLAPEIDGGVEIVRELVEQGWVVSIGHTRADIDTLDAAFAAGACHMTHFFNAMTGVHHREVGVAGWGLGNEGVSFDIIADGIHVHPSMLTLACRTKLPSKVALISDSVAPTGQGDGAYELWGETITVEKGRTQNERGSIAGSVITMADAVKRMLGLGFTQSEVAAMASTNPARIVGIEHLTGSVTVGMEADLVIVSADGDVRQTIIKGHIVEK
ncbi:MAG: N-acetylglucosamine-6-phosphate deacetylase [Pyrinomonadaceae bacterium]|nr:N-acetylglucosamine-6-phosphate deacetylase [Pyrinomonadaceae bacterium]MBP6211801.1 N-acetylglucosamine-6-phosphate deacetylase [Pyrinomonadaceae bacterium]